jgi:CRISPR-associated exonuclease Cas4
MSYYDAQVERAVVTLTDVLEYTFCPRFIFYMRCLDIPQHEEKRFKVRKGREVHEARAMTNKRYLRHKINVVKKESEVLLTSERHRIKGKVDEVLFLAEGTAAPLEYKFAEFKQTVWATHALQLTLQALLIQENYGAQVKCGFVCYTRSNDVVKKVDIKNGDYAQALLTIKDILKMIDTGYYPANLRPNKRCSDCCYRNICV